MRLWLRRSSERKTFDEKALFFQQWKLSTEIFGNKIAKKI